MEAASRGFDDAVLFLIESGATISNVTQNGSTALSLA